MQNSELCLNADADVSATDIRFEGFGSSFTIVCNRKKVARAVLNVPGEHNVRNALAAIAVAMEIGIPLQEAVDVLSEFRGVHRRFEFVGKAKGITIIDDYAHHPTSWGAP